MTFSEFQKATGVSDQLATRWFTEVVGAMAEFAISKAAHQAGFLAQIGTESQGFTKLVESMNYNVSGVKATFGSRITDAEARAWARPDNSKVPVSLENQQKIANKVYGNRYGNNSTGDGWRYRGRGLKQVTFLANYDECGRAIGANLLTHPELLEQDHYAALSAAWFWSSNRLGRFIDNDDFIGLTRAVNGGTNGLADRQTRWELAKAGLGVA